jgi:hypothetical protein
MRSIVRATLPCVYGGEEFAVILPATGIDEAGMVAERIRHNVMALDSGTGGRGWTRAPSAWCRGRGAEPAGDAHDIIKAADDALYTSKREGRNRTTLSAGELAAAAGEADAVAPGPGRDRDVRRAVTPEVGALVRVVPDFVQMLRQLRECLAELRHRGCPRDPLCPQVPRDETRGEIRGASWMSCGSAAAGTSTEMFSVFMQEHGPRRGGIQAPSRPPRAAADSTKASRLTVAAPLR